MRLPQGGTGRGPRELGTDTLTPLHTDTATTGTRVHNNGGLAHIHTLRRLLLIYAQDFCDCGEAVPLGLQLIRPLTSETSLPRRRIKDQTFVTRNIWPWEPVSAQMSPGHLPVSPCLLSPPLPH